MHLIYYWSLVKINLSYNHISDISGFKSLHGSEYKLSHIELHGNQLSSPQHVIKALIGCSNLRQLTLCLDGSSNPLCSDLDRYRSRLLSALTQLEVLDGVNRLGESVSSFDVLADIPGLENYMDFLVSQSSSVSDSKSVDVVTPKIDQALEKFRQRKSPTFASEMSATASDADTSAGISVGSKQSVADQEARLEFLELQLAQLIQGSKILPMKVIAVLCAEEVNPQEIANREDLEFLVIGKVQLLQGHKKKPAVPAGREPAQVHQSTVRLTTIDKGFCNYYSSELYNLQFVKTMTETWPRPSCGLGPMVRQWPLGDLQLPWTTDDTAESLPKGAQKTPSAVMVSETQKRDDIKSTYVRWVWSERYGSGLLVNTNNGLERQNKVFKYQFLEQRKNNNVSGMISSLVHQYLPAMMLNISTDKVARTGLALLEQLFPSEDSDNSDYDAIIEAIINDAKKLCPGLEEQHTFRFALLLLWTLVKKGKFQLHRNIEKEDEEARNSMAACIEALNSIQSLNPDGKRIIDSQHPRSILKMKDKSTKCIRKKVHFEGEADLNQPLTQMDRNQALDAVKKLWSLRESSNYIIARVSNYNVTDDDFKSLASRNWLTDQIVEPKKGLIYFYNPLTERRIQIREVQRNWCVPNGTLSYMWICDKERCKGAKEGDDLKDTAIEVTTRLKRALMNEREAKLRLQGDVEKLREHIHELNRQLKVAKEAEESLKGSLRALEEVTAKMERDKLQQQTHEKMKQAFDRLKTLYVTSIRSILTAPKEIWE
uniref:Leucine-rich repeat and coiled-coil domain-containing protein 1 n=1 Tax=Magallana gigas TaxID=29159 RepID=K1PSA2_MAGGI